MQSISADNIQSNDRSIEECLAGHWHRPLECKEAIPLDTTDMLIVIVSVTIIE